MQPEVASTTRVCAYDRAGEGWSDPGPEPRDAVRIATELHTLLERADIPGPFVLVGHSFGGLYARVFASRYPDQVEGMVLIDASHPDQWTRTPEGAASQRTNEISAAIAPWLARLGVLRMTGYIQVDPDLPAQQRAGLRAFTNGTRVWDSDGAVFRTIDRPWPRCEPLGTLGWIALVVLTATEHGSPPEMELLWQALQRELTGLSMNSRQHVVEGATHVSLVNNRERSSTSVEAIQQVAAAVRTGMALP